MKNTTKTRTITIDAKKVFIFIAVGTMLYTAMKLNQMYRQPTLNTKFIQQTTQTETTETLKQKIKHLLQEQNTDKGE
ncbi:MAG: hypothetical protein KGV50_02080 [Gammaproteobacteria bacterium]|nr:hypothetical protein [Gammaproteobacteria bacterium]